MLAAFPAFVRLYDILFDGGEDLRGLRWDERRRRLDAIVARLDAGRFDLSPVIEAVDFAALKPCATARATPRSRASCSRAATRLLSRAAAPASGTPGSAIRSSPSPCLCTRHAAERKSPRL